MAYTFTIYILEMITTIAEVCSTYWSNDLSTALQPDTSRAGWWDMGRTSSKPTVLTSEAFGGALPCSPDTTDCSPRLDLPAQALRAHGSCHSALSRCPQKLDQAGREGLVGII